MVKEDEEATKAPRIHKDKRGCLQTLCIIYSIFTWMNFFLLFLVSFSCLSYCIAGKYKEAFICLTQSQSNCNDCKPCSLNGDPAERWKTSWDHLWVFCFPSIFCPHPTPHRLIHVYDVRTINTEFLSTQCCCCTVLWWHSGSHLFINIIIIMAPLQYPLRKSHLTLFLGCHSAPFSRPLGCLESFYDSHLRVFDHPSCGPAFFSETIKTIWPE